MKHHFKNFILLSIILSSLVFVYFFNIISQKNWLWEDFPTYYFPAKNYVFQNLKAGHIPLWNPNLNLGYPIIADTTASVFYPLNWLVIPFITDDLTTNYWLIELWTIFHLFLAGLFMYYLADYLINEGQNKIQLNSAALLAAIAFMFSGFFIGHLKHVAQITTACWLPLIFLFLYKSCREQKMIYSVYAGVFWGLSLLSGHLQIVYHFSFWLGLFMLWELANNLSNKKIFLKIIASGVIMTTIALSLAAVQLLPFLEFLKYSTRQAVATNFTSTFSLGLVELLINLFLPHSLGGFKPEERYLNLATTFFWETAVYIGLLPLLLALIAIIKEWRKNSLVFFLIFSSLFCLGIALGDNFILHPLLLKFLPGLNLLRVPARFILPAIFSCCLLAGFGFKELIAFFQNLTKPVAIIFNKLLKNILLISFSCLVFLIIYYWQLTNQTFAQNFIGGLINFYLIANLIILILFWHSKSKLIKNRLIISITLIIVSFFDLWLFGWQFNNGKIKPTDYYPQNQLTNFLNNTPETPRIINDDYLMPNAAYVYNLSTLDSNHYMFIKDYYDFTLGLAENLYYYNQHRNFNPLLQNPTRLKLLGINYLVSQRHFDQRFESTTIADLYFNNNTYPRFILSQQAQQVKTNKDILTKLTSDYNPNQIIFLTEPIPKFSKTIEQQNNFNQIKIINNQPENIELQINNSDSRWLLINDIYYPGWQATIDNQALTIYQANHTFRGLSTPLGQHQIKLFFKPTSYLLGRTISLISLLIIIISIIINLSGNKNSTPNTKTKQLTLL